MMSVLIFFLTALLQTQFARTGWFYRYEAYLVVLSFVPLSIAVWPAISSILREIRQRPMHFVRFVALASLVILTFTERALDSLVRAYRATTNIYEQQYQMGTFLRDAYPGASVALVDIGAANF